VYTKDNHKDNLVLPAKGKILRVKIGYNPNSSSIGSMVFAIPAAMLGVAVGFGTLSGIIVSAFSKKSGTDESEKQETPIEPADTENVTDVK
jgi:hypothetical protein